ncbi:topoisomerase C-terminal repeat-containing protein [Bacillus sp. PS06]|nr:topoisomerase C-terminal repeat-containing protein [Bacillus sp. PS06]
MFFSGFKSITQRETSRAQGVCVSCPSPGQDTQTPKIPTSDCLSILSHNYFKWAKLSVNPLYFTVFLSYKWIITQNRTYKAGKHLDNEELEKVLSKTEGLGTEATRAGIITLLKQRNYIDVQKNKVFATEKAILLIDAIGEKILSSPEMTAKWEQRLGEIGKGKASYEVFMEQTRKLSHKIVEDAIGQAESWDFQHIAFESTGPPKSTKGFEIGKCLLCGGNVVDKGKVYGCSNYQKTSCNFIISKRILGKTISQAQLKKLISTGKTDLIKGFKKGDKPFAAALQWNHTDQKVTFLFSNPVKS